MESALRHRAAQIGDARDASARLPVGLNDVLLEMMVEGCPLLCWEDSIPMRRIKAAELYRLGFALAGLRDLLAEPNGDFRKELQVVRSAQRLLLSVSKAIAPLPDSESIRKALADYIEQIGSATIVTRKESLEFWQREKIIEAIDSITERLTVELSKLPVFCVPDRLGYNTDKLLNSATELLPKKAAVGLSESARHDFEEACRSFAFGLWTAVAFHMLRATETVMVELIERAGGTVPEEGSRNWSHLIRALGTTKEVTRRTLGRLERLKDLERNELMHAGRFLDETECSDVFDYTKNAMVPMLMHLAEPKHESGKPTS
jgi:hypothetical protein